MSESVKIGSADIARVFTWGTSPRVASTTVTGASNVMPKESAYTTYGCTVSGTGAVSATVVVQVTNDESTGQGQGGTQWLTLGTLNPSGTTSANDGITSAAAWRYVRMNVTAISGTNATLTANQGV